MAARLRLRMARGIGHARAMRATLASFGWPRAVGVAMGAFALLALSGCTTVEHVCEKKIDLVERELGVYDDANVKKQMTRKCIDEMHALKKSNPKQYECEKTCFMSSKHLSDVPDCQKECN